MIILTNKMEKEFNLVCDDCKRIIKTNITLKESIEGGKCAPCKKLTKNLKLINEFKSLSEHIKYLGTGSEIDDAILKVRKVKEFIEGIEKIEPCASQKIFIEKIKELAGDKLNGK